MDWSLLACTRRGHVTYRPEETALAEYLVAATPQGEAWRCLRCETYVLGAPRGGGPAEQAPIVLRGRALRDALITRLLAVERLVRALLLGLAGYAVVRFRSSQTSVERLFGAAVPAARPLASVFNIDLDTSPTVRHLRDLINSKPHTLGVVATLLFLYSATQVVEGVGLFLLQRWGEYFATVVTSAFLPLEVYELTERVTVPRVGALAINVAAVVYLLLSKRLFGLRGGHAAYLAERRSESLLEIEAAAATRPAEAAPGTARAEDARAEDAQA